jgi:hypothetical protein
VPVIALEGMPGAGKTTLAATLSRRGHVVVPEYATVDGSVIELPEHPAVDHDDAHQRNWLRKHQLATTIASPAFAGTTSGAARGNALARGGVAVWVDRDWITSLAYAHSLADDQEAAWALMADRVGWALRHLASGRLAVPAAYLVLHLEPAESLHRRRGQLDQSHPWSQPGPLSRLAEFYRAPVDLIGRHSPELAAACAGTVWVHVDHPTPRRAVAAAGALLRSLNGGS